MTAGFARALARAAALVKHRETARPIGENVLVVGLNVLFAASTGNRVETAVSAPRCRWQRGSHQFASRSTMRDRRSRIGRASPLRNSRANIVAAGNSLSNI